MKHPSLLLVGLLCALLCLSTTACSDQTLDESGSGQAQTNTQQTDGSPTTNQSQTGGYYTIACNGTQYTTTADADAITTDGSALVIIKAGTYRLSGHRQGQIRVKVAKTQEVTLILDGLTATSADTAPLYIESADRVYIETVEGTTSTLTDAVTYVFPTGSDKPNACLYSSEDLTFRGNGTLVVNGNYNNGIGCKNDVVIESGTIRVGAPNNAIKGNDSVTIEGSANVTVTKGEDGIKSDVIDKEGKGFVVITGDAKVSITCSDDALQAVAYITVGGNAKVTYQCGDNPANCDNPEEIRIAEGSMTEMT